MTWRTVIGAILALAFAYGAGTVDGFRYGKRIGVEAAIAEFDRQAAQLR